MKTRDIVLTGCVAAATLALTLALLWPANVSAKAIGPTEKTIGHPSMVVDGCRLMLRLTAGKYKAGEKPLLELIAANASSKPVNLSVDARMWVTSPVSFASRMGPMPTTPWKCLQPVSLKAGETKAIRIDPKVAVAAGQSVYFTLRVGKQQIRAASFNVPGGKALMANGVRVVQINSVNAKPALNVNVVEVLESHPILTVSGGNALVLNGEQIIRIDPVNVTPIGNTDVAGAVEGTEAVEPARAR